MNTWKAASGPAQKLMRSLTGVIFWILVWALISRALNKELLVPSPMETLRALGALFTQKAFWKAAGISMLRITGGFLLAAAAGCLGGILSFRFRFFDWLFSPLLHLIRSVPVASFIILALVWIQTPFLPVFISFLMVLPVFWGNIRAGMAHLDAKELEMGRVLGLSGARIWREIRLPALRPYFKSACITGLGFAWKSGVAAEVICKPKYSLGSLLQTAKVTLETPAVFALTVVIALLSLGLETILQLALKEEKP